MSEAVVLVRSPDQGAMDALATQLARRLGSHTVESEQRERWGLNPVEAALAARRDSSFLRRLRRTKAPLHFANHHHARYGPFVNRPYAVTVHDLIRHFDCHGYRPLIHRPSRYDRAMLALDRAGIRGASAVIAVSAHTKHEVVRHLHVRPNAISVIYPGLDATRFRPVPPARLPYPFLLFVGSEHPRKNIASLLGALRLLKQRPELGELKLVKVGGPGGDEAPFRAATTRAIRRLGLEREVILKGRVSHDELLALYCGASCLLLPSLHEGFGLPPLEAMACGCPVVVSDRGALPEIAGPAAEVCRPDAAAIAAGAARLLEHEVRRARLVAQGFDHVRQFSWDRATSRTRAVYASFQSTAMTCNGNGGARRRDRLVTNGAHPRLLRNRRAPGSGYRQTATSRGAMNERQSAALAPARREKR